MGSGSAVFKQIGALSVNVANDQRLRRQGRQAEERLEKAMSARGRRLSNTNP